MSLGLKKAGDTCDDSDWKENFQPAWAYTGLIVVILCSTYLFIDAFRHKHKRQVPGKLMIARTLVDFLWAILYFYMIINIHCDSPNNGELACRAFGPIWSFLFLSSLMYFGGICWDMYFTLVNPFRKPVSDSWQLHLFTLTISAIIASIPFLTGEKGYQYRQDYQICWTQNTSSTTSPNNIIILYVPLIAVIFGGLMITFWAIRRLKQRMLEETFELRWSVIKRQIAIVSLFTMNYVVSGCIWGPIIWITYSTTYGKYGPKPNNQPYMLSVSIVLTNIFDLIAWIAKDSFESCKMFRNPIKTMISSANNQEAIIEYNISGSHHRLFNNNNGDNESPKSSYSKSFNATNRDEKAEPLLLNQSNSNTQIKSHNNTATHSSLRYTLNTHSNTPTHNENNYSLESNQTTSSLRNKADLERNQKKKAPNLSRALRREVIVFITHGLAQAVKRTAKETQQTQSHAALDVWDADFDNVYSNRSMTNRKSQKSNPDLQNLDQDWIYKSNSEMSDLSNISLKNTKKNNNKDFDDDEVEDEDEDHSHYYSDEDDEYHSPSNRHHKGSNRSNYHKYSNNFDYEDSVLKIPEPPPQNVYFPDSIRKNPAEHRGAMDRFNIDIPGSKGDDVPFTDFAPHVFRYLRTKCYKINDKQYLESILPDDSEQCIGELVAKFSEGRSGAFFFYTKDNKYLIKTLHKDEAQLLLQILKKYREHYDKYPESYLAKFYGLHSIKLYSLVIYFVVMENVFPPNTEPQETYDIKGSWIARHTNHHSDEGKLMKDNDLHKQLLLDDKFSAKIYYQLYKDSEFLEKCYIMDYSLLLGIYYTGIDPQTIEETALNDGYDEDYENEHKYDKDNLGHKSNNNSQLIIDQHNHFYRSRAETYHTVMRNVGNRATAIKAKMIEGPGIYYIGVIDILQKWNSSKILERIFKVYFRCLNKDGISCVEPSFYRRRFLKKMEYIGIKPSQSNQKRTSSKKYQ